MTCSQTIIVRECIFQEPELMNNGRTLYLNAQNISNIFKLSQCIFVYHCSTLRNGKTSAHRIHLLLKIDIQYVSGFFSS